MAGEGLGSSLSLWERMPSEAMAGEGLPSFLSLWERMPSDWPSWAKPNSNLTGGQAMAGEGLGCRTASQDGGAFPPGLYGE